MYGLQVGETHPTRMLSCYRLQQSCKVMFLHVSVILSTGGVPGPGGSAPGGCWSRGSAARGCLVRGGLVIGGCLVQGGVCSGGGIPACTEADPPLERRLLLRTVSILLECILVFRIILLGHKYTFKIKRSSTCLNGVSIKSSSPLVDRRQ